MISIALWWFCGSFAIAFAQRRAFDVGGIVNDVIKPNDGLFSNVVEQFGIVSFSPTPSGTASVTPSISPSSSASSSAFVIPSPSPLASSSGRPSRAPTPSPSSSTSPSASMSPTPRARERRPAPRASSLSSPSPSPSTQCAGLGTVTLSASEAEHVRFTFRGPNGEEDDDFDITAQFGSVRVGSSRCSQGRTSTYVRRVQEGSNGVDSAVLNIQQASMDGILDSPQELFIWAARYLSSSGNEDPATAPGGVVSITVHAYNGSFPNGSITAERELSILECCTAVGTTDSSRCLDTLVAKVRVSKNADNSITLTALQNNPLFCSSV